MSLGLQQLLMCVCTHCMVYCRVYKTMSCYIEKLMCAQWFWSYMYKEYNTTQTINYSSVYTCNYAIGEMCHASFGMHMHYTSLCCVRSPHKTQYSMTPLIHTNTWVRKDFASGGSDVVWSRFSNSAFQVCMCHDSHSHSEDGTQLRVTSVSEDAQWHVMCQL